MAILDSIKDPNTGAIKPIAIIAAGGIAIVGVFLLISKGSSGSQAPASGTSAGISGDNTDAIAGLQAAVRDLIAAYPTPTPTPTPVGGPHSVPVYDPTPKVQPTPPAPTPTLHTLWGSDIPASIRAVDPTGTKTAAAFATVGHQTASQGFFGYGSVINLTDIATAYKRLGWVYNPANPGALQTLLDWSTKYSHSNVPASTGSLPTSNVTNYQPAIPATTVAAHVATPAGITSQVQVAASTAYNPASYHTTGK